MRAWIERLAILAGALGVLGFLWGIMDAEQDQALADQSNLDLQKRWYDEDQVANATIIGQQRDMLEQERMIIARVESLEATVRDQQRVIELLGYRLGEHTGRHQITDGVVHP